jgi:diguanylate cyclase (GGDEF)-like protein
MTDTLHTDGTNHTVTDRRQKLDEHFHESTVYHQSNTFLDKKIRADIYILLALIPLALLILHFSAASNTIPVMILLVAICAFFIYRRRQDQQSFHALLLESAQIDALTRINNHLGLEGALAREASRMKRHKIPFSILMIDIDDFSLINGVYGYKTGDQILQHIARMLGNAIRITDTIGRYSGEEFLVILANTAAKDAVLVGERIRKTLLEKPFQVNSESIHASISIGVAEYSHEYDSIDKLIGHADDALRSAKQQGKNLVCDWQAA